MPWCPVCKNEYKEGYTVCSDCHVNLVDVLEESKVVLSFGSENEIDEIIKFLEANDLAEGVEKSYDLQERLFEIKVPEEKFDFYRKKLFLFYREFKKNAVKEEAVEEKTEEPEDYPVVSYKDPLTRAQEYKSGAFALLFVGIVGAIFLALVDINVVKMHLTNESKVLVNVVMGFIFFIFITMGIKSIGSYKKLLELADKNNNLERDIYNWFTESVTLDMLTSNENYDDTEEILFFNRSQRIKALIKEKFPQIDASFADYVTEKIYNDKFEK